MSERSSIGHPYASINVAGLLCHDVYAVGCLGTKCGQCTAYRACPSCGGRLTPPKGGSRECICGTVLWVCYRGCVQAFAIPNPLFKIEEDII